MWWQYREKHRTFKIVKITAGGRVLRESSAFKKALVLETFVHGVNKINTAYHTGFWASHLKNLINSSSNTRSLKQEANPENNEPHANSVQQASRMRNSPRNFAEKNSENGHKWDVKNWRRRENTVAWNEQVWYGGICAFAEINTIMNNEPKVSCQMMSE